MTTVRWPNDAVFKRAKPKSGGGWTSAITKAAEGTFVSEHFETGDLSLVVDNQYFWNGAPDGGDPATDRIYIDSGTSPAGGSFVMYHKYTAGTHWTEKEFSWTTPRPELWSKVWIRVPDNYIHEGIASPNNQKLFSIWMDDYSNKGDGATTIWSLWPDGANGSTTTFAFSSGDFTVTGGQKQDAPFISVPADRGRWMEMVVRTKMAATKTSADGICQMWRRWEDETDFVKIHELFNCDMPPPDVGPQGYIQGNWLGYFNEPFPEDTVFQLDGLEFSDDGTSWLASKAPAAFTPLFSDDFSGRTVGESDPVWRNAVYVDDKSVSGTKSMRLTIPRGDTAPTCGGSHFHSKRHRMPTLYGWPEAVPEGNTVWMRMFFYFPSTFSFGYLFKDGVDEAEAAECGKNADGNNSGMKWLHFGPNGDKSDRIYQQLPSGRRRITQPDPADAEASGIRLQTEVSTSTNKASQSAVPVPLDQWVSIQLAAYVASDTTGWTRVWVNNDLVAEITGQPTIDAGDNATALVEWGIGDYWNGVPYTDGAAGRDDYWLDEILIATDLPGYGAPNGLDASGNVFIDPATRVGDLV